MVKQTKARPLIISLILIVTWLSSSVGASAQSETGYDLVDAVNNLRALHGLAPYKIDPWLMAYAQQHSDYQAATQTSTHEHSDGSLSLDLGLKENVAAGDVGVVTVAIVVNEIWVDWGHRHILVDYATGEIGAGVVLATNGMVYYTVNIRAGGEALAVATNAGTVATSADATVPFVPLITSTPAENGAIFHTVGSGQTLWSIAKSYGITVDELRSLNAMASGSTFIYSGQKLLIRPTQPATSVSPIETTPLLIQTSNTTTSPYTETATPGETAIPSPAFTGAPAGILSDSSPSNKNMSVMILFFIGIVGLLIAVIFDNRKSH
jgi:uncharacterized protein YkwD